MTERYTLEGGPAVEALLAQIIADVRAALEPLLPKDRWTSLLLIGGYGRGEGGVETLPDGTERPHNNLDFLLVTRNLGGGEVGPLKARLDTALGILASQHSLGLDLGMIDEAKLRRSPSLVMWYDARFGHKTILGDSNLMPSLTQFSLESVPAWDIRNLLVNRGSLFVINDLLIERGLESESERRTVVKHAVKGIIGYGDALLFAHGLYDWSYAEKRRRMQQSPAIPERFKALYEEAIAFRFRPDYSRFAHRDLKLWQLDLRCQLNEVHLKVERQRLEKPTQGWEGYIETALTATLRPERQSLLRQGVRLLRGSSIPAPASLSLAAALGVRMGGPREVLSATFPVVAYALPELRERSLARELLGGADLSPAALRRAYLRTWRTHGDINFATVVQKLGLTLEETP
jgi:hypothetical protein